MARKKKAVANPRGREEAVKAWVYGELGFPPTVTKTDVFRLHDDKHHRINIYGVLQGSVRMLHTFYITGDEGNFVSSPPISKKYHTDADDQALLQSRA